MSRLTHLCLGACTSVLLATAFLWTPSSVFASHEEPQTGYSRGCLLHKVALGENLTRIADRYDVSLEALARENGIKDYDLIVEGQLLCIPEQDRKSRNDWDSYGVPGHSYDPSAVNGRGGHQEQYGPQQYDYYDYDKYDYDKRDNGYGNSGYNNSGYSNSGYGNYPVKPGESYDPNWYNNQGHGYGNQGSWQPESSYHVPGKADDHSYGKQDYYPQESYKNDRYWKDEKHYPLGGATFPEYVPSPDGPGTEDEPTVPMQPDNEEPNGEEPNGEEPIGEG